MKWIVWTPFSWVSSWVMGHRWMISDDGRMEIVQPSLLSLIPQQLSIPRILLDQLQNLGVGWHSIPVVQLLSPSPILLSINMLK